MYGSEGFHSPLHSKIQKLPPAALELALSFQVSGYCGMDHLIPHGLILPSLGQSAPLDWSSNDKGRPNPCRADNC